MLECIEERENCHIPLPATHRIETHHITNQRKNIFDHKLILQHFLNEGRLTDEQVLDILDKSGKILEHEQNCVYVDDSSYIIGDIHCTTSTTS